MQQLRRATLICWGFAEKVKMLTKSAHGRVGKHCEKLQSHANSPSSALSVDMAGMRIILVEIAQDSRLRNGRLTSLQ